MEIYGVRINGLENPLGFRLEPVVCSWKVRCAAGTRQTWARLAVAADPDMSVVLWDREGAGLSCTGEEIPLALEPHTRYYVQVQVTDNLGDRGSSTPCWFETGKLREPWQGHWIGMGQGDAFHPEFSRVFSLGQAVRNARLSICGVGVFEAEINGEKVGSDRLAPFINDYETHLQVCTYDVTGMLGRENELRVRLGDGWYRGRFGLGHRTHYERPYALLAELRLEYADGSLETVATDTSWRYRQSCVAFSGIYDGEHQDYTLWDSPENRWRQAVTAEAPGALTDRYSPPVEVMQTLPVQQVIRTPAGETVLDFGQNFAGFVSCELCLPRGAELTLEFGEVLQQGNFYRDNYRTAKSLFRYVSDGKRRQVRPFFTFFGFRYVKVSGVEPVEPGAFTGCAVYSKMEQTGFLTTGNEKINRLIANSLWGLKSNFLDMPTDCPQRDERLGWCGDAQVFCRTAGYHMDTRAFYDKFLRDLRLDQMRNGGRVAVYLPNEFPGLYASVWSDIGTFLPWMLYTYYGSKTMLREHYPLMKDWVDFLHREDVRRGRKDLYDFGFQFGDWLALDGATEQSTFGRTDNGYVASMYYYASTRYVAEAAEILGYPEAQTYRERAERIRGAILEEYFTATGRLAVDTQTGYLVALRFGVYRDRQKMTEGLQNRLKKDCGRLTGGFVGATMMNTVLADSGMVQQAYELLFYEGFPGWLYAVNLGATTVWERWNSILPDGTVSGTDMNSLNHYSYGSVVEFLYRHSAGLIPLEPGFRRVRLEPKPDVRLGQLHCRFESSYGVYTSAWQIREDGSLSFQVEIPFGCEAELCLPEQELQVLASGAYAFTIRTRRDYLALYSGAAPLERLFADPRAVAILEEHAPQVLRDTNRGDREAMSKGLNEVRIRAALFRTPTDGLDRAIEKISALHAEG